MIIRTYAAAQKMELYSCPSGTILIVPDENRALVWDGAPHVSEFTMERDGPYMRSEFMVQAQGKPCSMRASDALATIGALGDATIPELLAALSRRMDERSNQSA